MWANRCQLQVTIMPSLVDRIIESLLTRPAEVSQNGTLCTAASYFEKARGLPSAFWLDEPEVVAEEVRPEDVRRLKEAMIAFAEEHGNGSWVLSKCEDPALKPFFQRILRRHLDGDAAELYQAMIALENLGEPVFAGRCVKSILDEPLNRALAREYLHHLPST